MAGFKTAFYRYPEFDLSVAVLANLDQAIPAAIAQGIAGILEPVLQPPHLFRAPVHGPTPPVSIADLLRGLAAGDEDAMLTPGARRFLRPAVRRELGQMLEKADSWTALGCEPLVGPKERLLGADVARVCYARGTGKSERTVVSVYYARDWLATYFDYEDY